jgi:hypothetical protein
MQTVMLEVPETQIVRWVRQLSPAAKRNVLKILVPRLDEVESSVDYGEQQIRELSARRGLNWDHLSEDQREQWVDTLLHES